MAAHSTHSSLAAHSTHSSLAAHSHSSLPNSRPYSPSAPPLTSNNTPSLNDAYLNDMYKGHEGTDNNSPSDGKQILMMMVVEDRDVDSNTCIYEEVQL
ncbi:hypothetical protein Pmani_039673 [Petrolisthes manimaculis]|uniref:Uncharacterized protein n=1 Tax=Petrolisthes manimaculis TaxID=1843537 RepID=A0AAE1TL49_9EUCA|nr:hypothetical protein Pmani_039673 [Petrolisthes manimaculis]